MTTRLVIIGSLVFIGTTSNAIMQKMKGHLRPFHCIFWIYIKFWSIWKKKSHSLDISEIIEFQRRGYLNHLDVVPVSEKTSAVNVLNPGKCLVSQFTKVWMIL